MSQKDITIMGWTFEQWAVAIGRIGGDPTTFSDFSAVRKKWLLMYRNPPSVELIIITLGDDDPRPMNYEKAADLFTLLR